MNIPIYIYVYTCIYQCFLYYIIWIDIIVIVINANKTKETKINKIINQGQNLAKKQQAHIRIRVFRHKLYISQIYKKKYIYVQ